MSLVKHFASVFTGMQASTGLCESWHVITLVLSIQPWSVYAGHAEWETKDELWCTIYHLICYC